MATTFTESFESGNLAGTWTSGSNPVLHDTGSVRDGTYSIKINFSAYGNSYIRTTQTAAATLYVRFYLYVEKFSTDSATEMFRWTDGSGNQQFVSMATSKRLFFNGSGWTLNTGVDSLVVDTWYLVQLALRKSTTDAFHEIKLNGTTYTDTTNDGSTNNVSIWQVGHAWGGVQTATYYIDAIEVSDSEYPEALPSGASSTMIVSFLHED